MTSTRSTLCCVALLAIAGCSNKTNDRADEAINADSNEPAGASEKLMTIAALPLSHPGPGTVVGKFHMLPAADGISTDGMGGGCLAFQDPNEKVCNVQDDCNPPPSYLPAAGYPYGYCADNRCWYKVTEAHCWKSGTQKPAPVPLEVGKIQETPVAKLSDLPAQMFTGPKKDRINARLIACLNKKFGKGDPIPCAQPASDPGHREVFGKVSTFTK